MITFVHKGNFEKTSNFLKKAKDAKFLDRLDEVARQGVIALSEATPVNTGKTAQSWDYEIKKTKTGATIYWTNSNVNDGIPIAILIQYGHSGKGGVYIEGTDFINPAMAPVFNDIADAAWKEVTR